MTDRDIYLATMGRVLLRIRESRERTQEWLARDSGISQSTISRFENGQSAPDAYELEALACSLTLTTSRLIEWIELAVDTARTQLTRKRAKTGAELEAHAILATDLVLRRRDLPRPKRL